MKSSHLAIILLAIALSAMITAQFTAETSTSTSSESVYDRIMRTGTIRCGYAVWPPMFNKDPNTGDLSGFMHDLMTELGKRMELNIEWTHELNFATYLQDMNNGKFDIECSGGWPNATRGKYAEYTDAFFFLPAYLYVRADDMRFDEDISKINNPSVRFATMAGEFSQTSRGIFAPNSTEAAVPPSSQLSEIMNQLIFNKADVVIYDNLSAILFMQQHPNKVRQIPSKPLKVIPQNISVPKGEHELRTMLNVAINELLYDGVIDQLLEKYNLLEQSILRVNKPYEVKK